MLEVSFYRKGKHKMLRPLYTVIMVIVMRSKLTQQCSTILRHNQPLA